MSEALDWLEHHVYVPILGGLVLLALIILLVWCCLKKYRRSYSFPYNRIGEYDVALSVKIEREKQIKQSAVRESAFLNCQFYLRAHPQYDSVQPLKELGSRIDKHWFRVRDSHARLDRLLSIMQVNPRMPVLFNTATCSTLKDLFSLLQHPYIFPVSDFDFAVEQNFVVTVYPISIRGSLKDVIYQHKFTETWSEKYSQRNRGLTLPQIQSYGRQILEGLLYLEEKGFPSHCHIQSGNVMFEHGVCRLAGYENHFLGYTSRVYPLIKRKLRADKNAIDPILFGHLLFEISYGYELDSAHPEPRNLIGHQSPKIVEILNFIFENESGYPTIKQISEHPFFSSVKLEEMKMYNPAPIHFSQAMKSVLKTVKKGKTSKAKSKSTSGEGVKRSSTIGKRTSRSSSVTSLETPTLATPPPAYPGSTPIPPPPPFSPGIPPPPPPTSSIDATVRVETPSLSGGRGALLGDIRKGAKLKKALTDDRSSPRV